MPIDAGHKVKLAVYAIVVVEGARLDVTADH